MRRWADKLRQLAWWAAQALVLFVFWLVLVGSGDPRELAAGAAVAFAGSVAMHVVERQHLAKLLVRPRWVIQIWRLPGYALVDTWQVLSVLAAQIVRRRPAPSILASVPYEPCDDGDASATERALAVAYTTMTPGIVVIGVDQERHRLVYHRLRGRGVPEMTRRLGARR